MKRKLLHKVAIVTALILCLGGCGKKGSGVNVEKIDQDPVSFASYILENVKFADELSQLEEDMVSTYYELPENVKGIVYVGSGATSEELSVLQAPDSKTADQTLEVAKTHISDQIESFESYLPKEVDKLKHAFVKKIGNDVVVIVSEGTDAETIVNDYLK